MSPEVDRWRKAKDKLTEAWTRRMQSGLARTWETAALAQRAQHCANKIRKLERHEPRR